MCPSILPSFLSFSFLPSPGPTSPLVAVDSLYCLSIPLSHQPLYLNSSQLTSSSVSISSLFRSFFSPLPSFIHPFSGSLHEGTINLMPPLSLTWQMVYFVALFRCCVSNIRSVLIVGGERDDGSVERSKMDEMKQEIWRGEPWESVRRCEVLDMIHRGNQ